MGREASVGIDIGSGGVGGEGRAGSGSGARSDRYGSAVVISGGRWTEVVVLTRDPADRATA